MTDGIGDIAWGVGADSEYFSFGGLIAEGKDITLIEKVAPPTSFSEFYRNLKKEINDWLDLGDF